MQKQEGVPRAHLFILTQRQSNGHCRWTRSTSAIRGHYPGFEHLRRGSPIHWRKNSLYGSFWSAVKFRNVMQVKIHLETCSSKARSGGTIITDRPAEPHRSSVIAMDPVYDGA
jgi:hypothetical protein